MTREKILDIIGAAFVDPDWTRGTIADGILAELEKEKIPPVWPTTWYLVDKTHNGIRILCSATYDEGKSASDVVRTFRDVLAQVVPEVFKSPKCKECQTNNGKMRDAIASLAADWVEDPEDVFTSERLEKWAIENGYIRAKERTRTTTDSAKCSISRRIAKRL